MSAATQSRAACFCVPPETNGLALPSREGFQKASKPGVVLPGATSRGIRAHGVLDTSHVCLLEQNIGNRAQEFPKGLGCNLQYA
jgi:hypothetical protein